MVRRSILAVTSMLLVVGCGSRQPESPTGGDAASSSASDQRETGGKIIRRGLPGEPRTLDPQLADDEFSFQVIRDLYEGLTAEDPHGRIVPGVAKSWTIDETGTVYTFHLRSNARWSDGSRVTAPQFVNGLQRAVDPRTASGSAELLIEIKNAGSIIAGKKQPTSLGVKALDDATLRIELTRPAPFILQILSQPISAPLRFNVQPLEKDADPKITDGPYVLASRIYGSYIEIARNYFYWDAQNVAIPRIRYLITESESTELNEYLAGQLDMTYTIPLPDLPRLIRERPSEVQLTPILATFYLALNMSEPRFKSSPDLRQALSMAIDRDLIADKVMLGVTPAFSFVPPGVQNYSPPKYKWAAWPRDRRLAYARALLAKAGYSNAHPLSLNIYFNSDETVRRVVTAIAESWRENLGVSAMLISDEFRVFLVRRKEHTHWDVARFGWSADYDDAASFLDNFGVASPQNDESYDSNEFDTLMKAARAEENVRKRRVFLEHAEAVLLGDYAIMPIYFYKARHLVKPYLGGATITPLNRTYSKFLYWKGARRQSRY